MDGKSINVCGDILTVVWNGNVWVSPSNGQQHSRYTAALAVELEEYEESCGVDDEDRTSVSDYEIFDAV